MLWVTVLDGGRIFLLVVVDNLRAVGRVGGVVILTGKIHGWERRIESLDNERRVSSGDGRIGG